MRVQCKVGAANLALPDKRVGSLPPRTPPAYGPGYAGDSTIRIFAVRARGKMMSRGARSVWKQQAGLARVSSAAGWRKNSWLVHVVHLLEL